MIVAFYGSELSRSFVFGPKPYAQHPFDFELAPSTTISGAVWRPLQRPQRKAISPSCLWPLFVVFVATVLWLLFVVTCLWLLFVATVLCYCCGYCLWLLFVATVCGYCLWLLFVATVCGYCLWLFVATVCGYCLWLPEGNPPGFSRISPPENLVLSRRHDFPKSSARTLGVCKRR